MEFRSFWDVLADLGIALPEPNKIKGQSPPSAADLRKAREQAARGRSSSRQATVRGRMAEFRPRGIGEVLQLLEAMQEADEHSATSGDRDWVAPGKTVKVDQYKIRGMVYVGEDLLSIRSYRQEEPALIRPKLKVQSQQPDIEGKQMPYQPSYTQIKPACRAAYLQWLADGRRDPKIHISYVWLFFYGLERRVFHDLLSSDLKSDPKKLQELDQIIAEVDELQRHYSDEKYSFSGPFSFKASLFLDVCRVIRSSLGDASSSQPITPTIDPSKAKSLTLQINLGMMAKRGEAIPADWALAWCTQLGRKQLRAVVTRCLDEFQTLFRLRYAEKYGEGIKLKPGKTTLMMEYYPANPTFGRSISIDLGNLPDVSRFTSKLNQLSQLVDDCTAALEPLGRFLGRTVDARNTPAAIALLPADLLPTHGGETVSKLRQWLDQCFANPNTQARVISGQELFQYWSGANPEKLAKAEAIGLSQLLARFGFGIEPDLALGGTAPTSKSHFALFRLPAAEFTLPAALSTDYLEATLLLRLAIAVASGTESPSLLEQKYLTSQLDHWAFLEPAEQMRLNAHLQMAIREKPLLRTLKTRIEAIAPDQRRAIAQFVIQVASADGQLAPKEVQHLEKVYTLLELEPQSLYSDIHDLSTRDRPFHPASEPVTVQPASPKTGYKIPSASTQGKHKQPELTLDMNLVQSKLEESKVISNLLSEIFVDEQETVHHVHHATPEVKPKSPSIQHNSKTTQSTPAKSKTKTKSAASKSAASKSTASELATPPPLVAGLDAAHSELLVTLAKQPIWQRTELAAISTRLNLMLDGALEVINEVAFDRCDEALIEGDNPIEVNADVLRELMA